MSNGRGRALVAGIVAGLALAAPAQGSVITLEPPDFDRSDRLTLTGQPGEANRVRLQAAFESPPIFCCPDPGSTWGWATIDDKAGIDDAGPCLARNPTHAECVFAAHRGFIALRVALGDRNDLLDVTTDQWIPSELGAGDDQLIVRAGSVNGTDCGEGFDTVVADPSVEALYLTGCERVIREALGGV
jgi:hypothetical protein